MFGGKKKVVEKKKKIEKKKKKIKKIKPLKKKKKKKKKNSNLKNSLQRNLCFKKFRFERTICIHLNEIYQ